MGSKVCTKCKIEKPLSDYHWNSKKHKYKRAYCKECGRKARRDWRESKKDGYWYVYLLPEHNYVGITECVHERMNAHKNTGKNVEGYKILGSFKTGPEAALMEAKYHCDGYNGFNYGGKNATW